MPRGIRLRFRGTIRPRLSSEHRLRSGSGARGLLIITTAKGLVGPRERGYILKSLAYRVYNR